MSKKNNQYLGQGGHHFVMGELLCRGWNVAIPEVDKGDDLFVVKDDNGEFRRVQVKTATGKEYKTNIGFSVTYSIRMDQLRAGSTPELHYIFVARLRDEWQPLLIIERNELEDIHVLKKVGTISKRKKGIEMLGLRFQFKPLKADPTKFTVTCSKQNFTGFIQRWGFFKIIPH